MSDCAFWNVNDVFESDSHLWIHDNREAFLEWRSVEIGCRVRLADLAVWPAVVASTIRHIVVTEQSRGSWSQAYCDFLFWLGRRAIASDLCSWHWASPGARSVISVLLSCFRPHRQILGLNDSHSILVGGAFCQSWECWDWQSVKQFASLGAVIHWHLFFHLSSIRGVRDHWRPIRRRSAILIIESLDW